MKLISSNCIAIRESLVPELEIEVKYCNIILKYTLNNNNFQILRLSPLDHLNYIYIYAPIVPFIKFFFKVTCIRHSKVRQRATRDMVRNPL